MSVFSIKLLDKKMIHILKNFEKYDYQFNLMLVM